MASDEPGTPRGGTRRAWLRATLLALAWVALGLGSRLFVFAPLHSSAIWLASGLALAVLVRTPRRDWPLYGLALFLAEALPGFFAGIPWEVNLLWGVGDSLSVLAGAWLLRSWPGPPLRFRQLRDVAGLLLALVVGSLLSATFGATAVTLGLGHASFGWQWLMWYLGDVLGGMMVAALVLAWGAPERGRSRRPSHPWELGVTVAGLVLLAHVLFSAPKPQGILVSLPYACLPAVLWMALRHGPRGGTLGTVVVGTLAAWHTAAGRGPFGNLHEASAADAFLLLQAFLAMMELSALCLAALVCERQETERIQRLLSQASAILAGSMDERVTMPRIAELVVPDMASGFAAWRREPGGALEPVVQVGLEPGWRERLEERLQREEEPGLSRVEARGGGAVVARLRRHGKGLGGIALVRHGPDARLSARELAFAGDLAYRCALALENESLFQQAQEAIDLRDAFTTVAAYELRSPLTSLRLYLQDLMRGLGRLPNPEKPLAQLHQLARQSTRLSQLVENLLVMGRINTGRLNLERQTVDLSELVRHVVERLAEDLKKARCVPVLKLRAHTMGEWDRVRLEQALVNLLGNAMKFGAGHPIDLEVSEHQGVARLRVRDHGIGVAPEAMERIFGRFERAVSSSEYGGLGLGLFLTREIVAAHGGSIQAESGPGEGTTFTLELPAASLTVYAEQRPNAP
ncbi:MASE1 domain-containing protein [Archangium sp.]|uniref:sensor histidine kinase n=1 Tax=Archangium sp. TaxID=1872627 RepID=UPI00389B340A